MISGYKQKYTVENTTNAFIEFEIRLYWKIKRHYNFIIYECYGKEKTNKEKILHE